MNPKIEISFTYHPPKEGQSERYLAIRNKAKELAYLIDELCPSGRESSVAITHLETAVAWANKAIAVEDVVVSPYNDIRALGYTKEQYDRRHTDTDTPTS